MALISNTLKIKVATMVLKASSTIIMDLEETKTTKVEVAEAVLAELEATIQIVVTRCRWLVIIHNTNNNNNYSKYQDSGILNRFNKTCLDKTLANNHQWLNNQDSKLFIFLNMIVSSIKV